MVNNYCLSKSFSSIFFILLSNVFALMSYGLFPPTETETETDSQTDSKRDRYIVLCTTFSTGTEMETETEMETFPDGYCTHFRDGSPSLFRTFESGDWNLSTYQWKNLHSTRIHLRIRLRLRWWK